MAVLWDKHLDLTKASWAALLMVHWMADDLGDWKERPMAR
jgi:hypothetical protein